MLVESVVGVVVVDVVSCLTVLVSITKLVLALIFVGLRLLTVVVNKTVVVLAGVVAKVLVIVEPVDIVVTLFVL